MILSHEEEDLLHVEGWWAPSCQSQNEDGLIPRIATASQHHKHAVPVGFLSLKQKFSVQRNQAGIMDECCILIFFFRWKYCLRKWMEREPNLKGKDLKYPHYVKMNVRLLTDIWWFRPLFVPTFLSFFLFPWQCPQLHQRQGWQKKKKSPQG